MTDPTTPTLVDKFAFWVGAIVTSGVPVARAWAHFYQGDTSAGWASIFAGLTVAFVWVVVVAAYRLGVGRGRLAERSQTSGETRR